MNRFASLCALAALVPLVAACQRSDEPADAARAPAPEASAPRPVGTIVVDGRTWNVIADVQCSVGPGPVVSIAGHAADDEAVEIVIDYNGNEGPTGASVRKADGSVDWTAYASMNFQIERQRVQGTGFFTGSPGGVQQQANGQFDVDCAKRTRR